MIKTQELISKIQEYSDRVLKYLPPQQHCEVYKELASICEAAAEASREELEDDTDAFLPN